MKKITVRKTGTVRLTSAAASAYCHGILSPSSDTGCDHMQSSTAGPAEGSDSRTRAGTAAPERESK